VRPPRADLHPGLLALTLALAGCERAGVEATPLRQPEPATSGGEACTGATLLDATWTEARQQRLAEAFAEREDIDFAYPTTRYYDNVREGKPQARAQPLPPA